MVPRIYECFGNMSMDEVVGDNSLISHMFDLVIKNGSLIDGTGSREFPGDLGIKEEKIAAIGDLGRERARRIIDASGHYVTPGFIDINNHSDTHWQIFANPDLESLVRQGITTIVGGGCGSSLAPLSGHSMLQSIQKWTDVQNINVNWASMEEFLREIEQRSLSVNFGTFIGHSTLRRSFVRDESRALRSDELLGMESAVRQSLREGALGMSTGLAYVHGRHATEHELSALASVVGKYNGLCVAHLRNEGKDLALSVGEAVAMARQSGVRLHILHLKAVGRRYWDEIDRALYFLEASDSDGVDVSFDVYPYRQTASVLYTLLPTWVTDGGKKLMLERLRDPSVRQEAIHDLQEERIDYSSAYISLSSLNRMVARNNVLEIAKAQGKLPEEILFDALLASDDRATISLDAISESNLEKEIQHPFSIISSNGIGYPLSQLNTGESVHPRCFGSFPRVLARYVRDKKVLGWEEAIHKMTGKPARKVGMRNRGTIAVGNFADIVVLHPGEVQDRATTENPFLYPAGIPYVVVNGSLVVDGGEYTHQRVGMVLRRESGFFERFW